MVKIEFQNPRYLGPQLREYMSEFIHYSRYAGINLNDFHRHLSKAELKPMSPESQQPTSRLVMETTQENLNKIQSLIESYAVFNTWKIRILSGKKGGNSNGGHKPKKSVSSRPKPAAKNVKAASKKPVPKKSPARSARKPVSQKTGKTVRSGSKRKPATKITVEKVLISGSKKKGSASAKSKSKSKKPITKKTR